MILRTNPQLLGTVCSIFLLSFCLPKLPVLVCDLCYFLVCRQVPSGDVSGELHQVDGGEDPGGSILVTLYWCEFLDATVVKIYL